ncbi:hypothetical protein ONS96_000070 [Cadophora gregata f. sp. sojae]|nr:hypothetical protein ONS96_000070 [Cadophora gregata f. sp. sojae]
MDLPSSPPVSPEEDGSLLPTQPQQPNNTFSNDLSAMPGEEHFAVNDSLPSKNTAGDNVRPQGSSLPSSVAHAATPLEGDLARNNPPTNPTTRNHLKGYNLSEEHESCRRSFEYQLSALNTRLQDAIQVGMKTDLDLIRANAFYTYNVRQLKDTHQKEMEALRKKMMAEHEKEVQRSQKLIEEPKQSRSAHERLQVENRALKKKAADTKASKEPLAKENQELKATLANLNAEHEQVKKALGKAKARIQQNTKDTCAVSLQHERSLEEYKLVEADLLESRSDVKALQRQVEDMKSQKAEFANLAQSLELKIAALEKDQANEKPLVDVGTAIRMRHMVLQSIVVEPVSRREKKLVQAGNIAAHEENIEADLAVFTAGTDLGEYEKKYFQMLHGMSPNGYRIMASHIARFSGVRDQLCSVPPSGGIT